MKKLALFAVLIAPMAVCAADGWWTESKETLPVLIAQGYEIAGFAIYRGSSGITGGDMTYTRYVLQKGSSVFQCFDNAIATPMGQKSKAYCEGLATP